MATVIAPIIPALAITYVIATELPKPTDPYLKPNIVIFSGFLSAPYDVLNEPSNEWPVESYPTTLRDAEQCIILLATPQLFIRTGKPTIGQE
jgi:hypothetical protein